MSSDNEPTPSTSKSSDNESISQETDSPISDNSNPSTSGNEVSLYEEWINPLQDWELRELLIPAVIVRTNTIPQETDSKRSDNESIDSTSPYSNPSTTSGNEVSLDEGCRVSVIYSLL